MSAHAAHRWVIAGLTLAAVLGVSHGVHRVSAHSFRLTTAVTGREPRVDLVILRRTPRRCLLRVTRADTSGPTVTLTGHWQHRTPHRGTCLLPAAVLIAGLPAPVRGVQVRQDPTASAARRVPIHYATPLGDTANASGDWLLASGQRTPVLEGSVTRLPPAPHGTQTALRLPAATLGF